MVYERYCWDFNAEYFSTRTDVSNGPEQLKIAMQAVAEIVEALAVEDNEVVTAPAEFEVDLALENWTS